MGCIRLALILLGCIVIGGCGSSKGRVSVVSQGGEVAENQLKGEVVSQIPEPHTSPLDISKNPVTTEPVKPALPVPLNNRSQSSNELKEKEGFPRPESSPALENSKIFAQSAYSSSLPMHLGDVFFDYDQMAIRPEAVTTLEQNAKILMARFPEKKLVIEGHCDERGTEEYNLILGERRAKAVRGFLVDLGVPSSKMTVISYGKTKPFCHERTHACLQQNRRAHFVLQ